VAAVQTTISPDLTVREADDGTAVLEGRVVPYNVSATIGGAFAERFAPGSVDPADLMGAPILWNHDRAEVVGHITEATEADDGPHIVAQLIPTSRGRDAILALRHKSVRGLSVGFEPIEQTWSDDNTTVTRTKVRVREVSVATIPAYPDAEVLAVRKDTPTMPDTDTLDVRAEVAPLLEPLTDRLDQIEARAFAAPTPEQHWSTQYRNAYDYACAVWQGKDETRALDTGLTSDNGGLVVAQWLRDVQRIIDRGRPGIQAFGTAPLPASGMSFTWPTYSAGSHVAAQPTGQANELTSVAVDIAMSSAVNIGTYGGAMRAAFQLLERSDPAYAPLWNQAMAAAYNNVTDNVFVDALTSGASDGSDTVFDFDSGSETGATLRAALFAASVDVETATGMPAEFALVASDVFVKVGGYSGLPDPGYGAGANAEGVSSARNLRVDVSGIQVIHDRNLANGTILVSNSSAAKWHEAGPFFVSQDQVGVLARDVAIYGYGVTAQYLSAGVVNLKASYA
jgi:HK97 family phage prohead protease